MRSCESCISSQCRAEWRTHSRFGFVEFWWEFFLFCFNACRVQVFLNACLAHRFLLAPAGCSWWVFSGQSCAAACRLPTCTKPLFTWGRESCPGSQRQDAWVCTTYLSAKRAEGSPKNAKWPGGAGSDGDLHLWAAEANQVYRVLFGYVILNCQPLYACRSSDLEQKHNMSKSLAIPRHFYWLYHFLLCFQVDVPLPGVSPISTCPHETASML